MPLSVFELELYLAAITFEVDFVEGEFGKAINFLIRAKCLSTAWARTIPHLLNALLACQCVTKMALLGFFYDLQAYQTRKVSI